MKLTGNSLYSGSRTIPCDMELFNGLTNIFFLLSVIPGKVKILYEISKNSGQTTLARVWELTKDGGVGVKEGLENNLRR